MPYYLSPYIGGGTRSDPFRVTGSDQAGWSAIDIRADKGVTLDGGGFGYALLWLPDGTTAAAGLIKIGQNKLENATNQIKNRIQNLTGLDLSADVTFQDIVETLLVSPPPGWWNAIRPANGRLEAWLGGERIVDNPILAGGSISDNFTRANETPLATPWTVQSGSTGTINLATNAITKNGTGNCFYYYNNAAGWNADQTSELVYASATLTDWGPAVRVGSNGLSGYFYVQDSLAPQGPCKLVAGAFTIIESAATLSTTVGVAYKISAVGSTIRYYANSVEDANSPATDTSLTTAGNGAGVFIFATGGSLDNFLATGEVAAAAKSLLVAAAPMKHLLVR